MSLQTQNLVMTGLGILNDVPPNSIQPKIIDGVHLRWAFKPKRGFPWYGYYIFRRRHRKGSLICLGHTWSSSIPGSETDNKMSYQFGYVGSDIPLRMIDDFPVPSGDGKSEFDLRGCKYLKVRLKAENLARRVDVILGFHDDARIKIKALLSKIPVAEIVVSGNQHQIKTATIEFDAIDAIVIDGGPAALIDVCVVLVTDEATKGWEPLPEFKYPLLLPIFHPDYPLAAGAEDLEAARQLARARILYGDHPDHYMQSKDIKGKGRISVVYGSSIVAGHSTQWTENIVGQLLEVQGDATKYTILQIISDNKLILSRNYKGTTQNNVLYQICQDTFGHMHDQLVHLVSGGATANINMVDRTIPIPVYSSGNVSIKNGSDIVDGVNTYWDLSLIGLNFQIQGENTVYSIKAVNTPNQLRIDRPYIRPSIKATTYRIFAALVPPGSKQDSPRMPEQKPLDLLLIGALHPAMAQMIGLYWVDQTAENNTAYDYLIIADHTNSFKGDEQRIIDYLNRGIFPEVDGYIVFNKKKDVSPPLSPPKDVKAYALPGSFILTEPDGELLDAQNNAGILWDSGKTGNILLPGAAVMYHVWRANLGKQTPAIAPHTEKYLPITKSRPILVTQPLHNNTNHQRPPNWPPFNLSFVDRGLDEFAAQNSEAYLEHQAYKVGLSDGWYSYMVSGIDLFGRHSAGSSPAKWYQWIPVPDPPPWYYKKPPGDREINPFAIRLLDKIPPPPPTGIEAYILDPSDPYLIKDEAYKKWQSSLRQSEKDSLVGLRVSWLWTPAHMRQAPDLSEFRIYFIPGHMNAKVGNVVSAIKVSSNEYDIETNIVNSHPAGAYQGAIMNIGPESYIIISSKVDNKLKFRIKMPSIHSPGTATVEGGSNIAKTTGANVEKVHIGKRFRIDGDKATYTILEVNKSTQELTLDRAYEEPKVIGKPYKIFQKLPREGVTCNIALPTPYNVGTITLSNNDTIVHGKDTAWHKELSGSIFQIMGESETYTIISIDTESQLKLDSPYQGPSRAKESYRIIHPFTEDYTVAKNWEKRLHVVTIDENVTETIRIAQDVNGSALKGDSATLVGNLIYLDGKPDLSVMTTETGSPFAAYLYLKNDTNRSSKLYRIIQVDVAGCTVVVDESPNIFSASSEWAIGLPIRKYEVFLPAPQDNRFVPSLANPIVYANIGVSSVDDKTHTLDDPKWDLGDWDGRHGNEGRVGGLATIVRVRRIQPDAPEPPPDSEKVYASLPDYHGHSYYTYRWEPKDNLKTHIFRALDDTLFKTDWALRSQNKALLLDPTNSEHKKLFPPDWDVNKHQPVADQLKNFVLSGAAATVSTIKGGSSALPNGLVALDGMSDLSKVKTGRDFIWLAADTESRSKCYSIIDVDTNALTVTVDGVPKLSNSKTAWAIPLYETLSNDALRVLAGLHGNDQAFVQLTIQPLDPKDPNTTNRRGPDDPDGFQLDTANSPLTSKSLRAYIATIDGRSTNRYFFRSAYVDGAHNRSKELSLSSPPVYLRNIIPPRPPVITKVLGGDRQITLRWASNREQDLKEYRIYRTSYKNAARDIRLMEPPVCAEAVTNGDPASRPVEVAWIDTPVPSLVTYYYRLVAVDNAGNVSAPSQLVVSRAYDLSPPQQPTWEKTRWIKLDQTGKIHSWSDSVESYSPAVELIWSAKQSGLKCLVQRMKKGTDFWATVSKWLDPDMQDQAKNKWLWSFYDNTVSEMADYVYQVKIVNITAQTAISEEKEAQKG